MKKKRKYFIPDFLLRKLFFNNLFNSNFFVLNWIKNHKFEDRKINCICICFWIVAVFELSLFLNCLCKGIWNDFANALALYLLLLLNCLCKGVWNDFANAFELYLQTYLNCVCLCFWIVFANIDKIKLQLQFFCAFFTDFPLFYIISINSFLFLLLLLLFHLVSVLHLLLLLHLYLLLLSHCVWCCCLCKYIEMLQLKWHWEIVALNYQQRQQIQSLP